MVDYTARIHVVQHLKRLAMTLLFLIHPGGERLLHNPAARAFEPCRHRVHLVG